MGRVIAFLVFLLTWVAIAGWAYLDANGMTLYDLYRELAGTRVESAPATVSNVVSGVKGLLTRAADTPVPVRLNGQLLPQQAVVRQGVAYLPARDLAQILGAEVHWDKPAATVKIGNHRKQLAFQVGQNEAYLSGGVAMVPARQVVEAFGGQVGWNDRTLIVTLDAAPPEVTAESVKTARGEPEIIGSPEFRQVMGQALKLLREKYPEGYTLVCDNLTAVREGRPSGADVWLGVFTNGSLRDPTWEASELVHEATHVRLFKEGETFDGEEGERQALEEQRKAYLALGGWLDANWVEEQLATRYWEVPIEKRDW